MKLSRLLGEHTDRLCVTLLLTLTGRYLKRATGLYHLKLAEKNSQSVLDALYLVSNVNLGHEWTVNAFCGDIVNAITANKVFFQFKEGQSRPVGLQTFCFLSDEEAQQNIDGGFSPTQETYLRETGDQLWLYWTAMSPEGCGLKFMYQIRRLWRPVYGKRPVFAFRDTDNCSKIHRGST